MLTEHRLSVTLALNQLLPPRLPQSGQVQGGSCCFSTVAFQPLEPFVFTVPAHLKRPPVDSGSGFLLSTGTT